MTYLSEQDSGRIRAKLDEYGEVTEHLFGDTKFLKARLRGGPPGLCDRRRRRRRVRRSTETRRLWDHVRRDSQARCCRHLATTTSKFGAPLSVRSRSPPAIGWWIFRDTESRQIPEVPDLLALPRTSQSQAFLGTQTSRVWRCGRSRHDGLSTTSRRRSTSSFRSSTSPPATTW